MMTTLLLTATLCPSQRQRTCLRTLKEIGLVQDLRQCASLRPLIPYEKVMSDWSRSPRDRYQNGRWVLWDLLQPFSQVTPSHA